MAGLLDFNFDDPQQAGLLALAKGLFAAGAPQTRRVGLGEALAGGMGQMQQAQMQAQMIKQRQEMMDAQLAMERLKEKRAQADFENKQNWYKGFMGNGGQAPMQGGQAGASGAGMSQQQSALANMSIDQLAQAAVLGMPGAKELFDLKKYADNGIERKPNTIYRNPITNKDEYISDPSKGFNYDPNTKTVTPLAGFSATNAAMKGDETAAIEAAKAANDLVTVNLADGPVQMTRQRAIQLAGGGQAPSSPIGSGNGLDISKLSPQQMKVLQMQDPEAFANGVISFGQSRQAPQTPMQSRGNGLGIPLQTEAQKEFEVGNVRGRQGTANSLNDNWIKQSYNPTLDAGKSSKDILGGLDALKTIDLKTGWGTEAKASAANVLTSLGIAPQNAEMYATNVQKFQSVAMGKLLDTLAAQKGPQTEGDSTRAQQTFAMLKNTNEANQFIADFARAKANMDVRKANFYQDALPLGQQIGDLNEIDRRWKKIQGSIWDDPALQPYKGSR